MRLLTVWLKVLQRGWGLVIVCCLSAACAPQASLESQPTATSTARPQLNGLNPVDFEPLLAKAAQEGQIKIVVELMIEPPFQAEGYLPDPTAVEGQRTAIKQAQEAVLSELAAYEVQVIFQPAYVPQIVLAVDEPALRALLSLSQVSNVLEDKLSVPQP